MSVSIWEVKTEDVYEPRLLFRTAVGAIDAFFPPHHKGEWNSALNHQKSSVLSTQICAATIHTGQFHEEVSTYIFHHGITLQDSF